MKKICIVARERIINPSTGKSHSDDGLRALDGYFEDVEDAHAYLKTIKYPRDYLFDALEVIETMSKIGAKVVWAHSIYGLNQRHISHEQVEEFVTEFINPIVEKEEMYHGNIDMKI